MSTESFGYAKVPARIKTLTKDYNEGKIMCVHLLVRPDERAEKTGILVNVNYWKPSSGIYMASWLRNAIQSWR